MNIIKADGGHEPFNEIKLKNSVVRACFNVRLEEEKALEIAEQVVNKIKKWLGGKQEVKSSEIFKKTAELLVEINEEAALMYEGHRDIS